MSWAVALFCLGYLGQAGLLMVLGTAATPSLQALAAGNALLCSLLLGCWYLALRSRRRRDAPRHLALVGVLLFTPAFFLPTLARWYEDAGIAMRTADTDLYDVTDEPLLGAGGHVLGVRVGFTLIPPETGYYMVEPVVRPSQDEQARLRESLAAAGLDPALAALRTVRRTIDPQPEEINARRLAGDVLDHAGGGLYLEEGVAYGFTFDLLPAYLMDPRDPMPVRNANDLEGYCLALSDAPGRRAPVDVLAALDRARPWRIAVRQTTFGWDEDGLPAADTLEAYAPAMFYRGALAEGLPACGDPR